MKKYIIIDVYLNPVEKYKSVLAEVLYKNKISWMFDVYVSSHLTPSDVRFINCPENIVFKKSVNSLTGMSVDIYTPTKFLGNGPYLKINNGYYYVRSDIFEAEDDEHALLLYKLYDEINE